MRAAGNDSLHELAQRPLFEPLRALLEDLPRGGVPDVSELNRLLRHIPAPPAAPTGMPSFFVARANDALSYEERVYQRGEVATRAGDWHDFFNAAVWLTFPRAKAALNARHYHALRMKPGQRLSQRGAVRDAATQFDECGMVVASADPALVRGLREHAWKHVFWERRHELSERVRFFVFGHATYDQLRRPFRGLCAKALFMDASPPWLTLDLEPQCAAVDAWLCELFNDPRRVTQPSDLAPLPVLGIPGVVAENGNATYYDDTRQFRPKRAGIARPARREDS
ncbi:MAG TPA: DUF3025 domain-containing protein [Acidiferrobacterales bacterium]|nr:DUF3025 domain-containing protein [Acidiferrobacterales bacterium]